MLNKVIIMGRLTRDPEFRQTTSGVPVCRFTVAVDRNYSNQNGERQADFINVTAWRSTAEFVSRYFTKGSMIVVEGSLQNDDYTDNNGVKHYRMQVVADQVYFGESKRSSQGGGDYSQRQQSDGGWGTPPPQQQGWGGQQQSAPQRPAAPAPAAPPQDSMNIGDLSDFEEILSDGEVPF